MATVIRLRRGGMTNNPVYHVVVADSRKPRDGRFIEKLGTYYPKNEKDKVKWDLEKVNAWVAKGATPSDTVRSLMKQTQA